MNGSDVMNDKKSQTDYEDSRSFVLLYAANTGTINEGLGEKSKCFGKTKEAKFETSIGSNQDVAMSPSMWLSG